MQRTKRFEKDDFCQVSVSQLFSILHFLQKRAKLAYFIKTCYNICSFIESQQVRAIWLSLFKMELDRLSEPLVDSTMPNNTLYAAEQILHLEKVIKRKKRGLQHNPLLAIEGT